LLSLTYKNDPVFLPEAFVLPNTDTSTDPTPLVKINSAAVTELVSGCLYNLYISETDSPTKLHPELGSVTDSSPREVKFAWPSDYDSGAIKMDVRVQIWHPSEPTKID